MSRSLLSDLWKRRAIVMAILGAALIAAGAALVYLPAGFAVAGVALIVAAYIDRYMEVRSATAASADAPD